MDLLAVIYLSFFYCTVGFLFVGCIRLAMKDEPFYYSLKDIWVAGFKAQLWVALIFINVFLLVKSINHLAS